MNADTSDYGPSGRDSALANGPHTDGLEREPMRFDVDEPYRRRFLELDNAMRSVLVEFGVRFAMTGLPSALAQAAIESIEVPEPSIEETADWIAEHGGIMRSGNYYDVGGKLVTPDVCRNAKRLLAHRG